MAPEGFGEESAYEEDDQPGTPEEASIGQPREGADEVPAQSGEGDYGQRGDETDFGRQGTES